MTYLEERATRGEVALFDRLMARVPDVPPVPGDELAIPVRQANNVEANRGTIAVTSEKGRGTSVTMTLPKSGFSEPQKAQKARTFQEPR